MTFARASAWRWKVLMATVGSLALMISAQAAPEATTTKSHATKTTASKAAASKSSAGSKSHDTKKPDAKTASKAHTAKPHAAKSDAHKSGSKKTESKSSSKPTATKATPAKSAAKPTAAKSHPVHAASPPPARHPAPRVERKPTLPSVVAATSSTSQADLGALQNVINLVQRRKQTDATQVEATISDPVARKLAEWIILRSPDNGASVERYQAFIAANPGWPSQTFLRRRAEAALWDDRRDDAAVLGWFQREAPLSYKGKLVLGRALLARGDRANAERLVREAWRDDDLTSSAMESAVLDQFGALLQPSDQKARMDALLYENANEAALRAAHRLGSDQVALARARIAV